ncbi:SDR family NAD(P)-dependent oxidoreductase [Oscillospiraceae bacterium MB08-C2-2]|nr:SDR family NAD(P)-dependent oxidoreductase [Oscillospiraceae bacterium MB08-C2-2]
MSNKTISFDVTGKVALVTGASYGLGIELATTLAEYGADIAVLARSEDKLQGVAAQIREKTGRRVLVVPCDITNEQMVKDAVKKVLDEYGHLDILVNNSGTIEINPPEEYTMEQWNKVIGVDLTGVFLMCRECVAQYMKGHGGRIINISSVSAFGASGGAIAYNAAKAGVVHMTRSMAVAWAPYGIYVNGIAPGQMTNGEMSASTPAAVAERIIQKVPLKRLGAYGDLSGALIFFASDACTYTVGETVLCDGGMAMVL